MKEKFNSFTNICFALFEKHIEVSGVHIVDIEIAKSSDGYRELMSVTKDIATATTKAKILILLRNK